MNCLVCEKETTQACSRCKSVSYCSVVCQKGNWKEHKTSCRPLTFFAITEKEEEGDKGVKYAKAMCGIKLGEIIHEESPIFHLFQSNQSENAQKLCITCGQYDDMTGKLMDCKECGWPCDKKCSEMAIHKEFECSYFKSHGIKYKPKEHRTQNLRQIILMTRVILIKRDKPELWNSLLELGLQNQSTEGIEWNPLCLGKTLSKSFTSQLGQARFDEAVKDCIQLNHLILTKGFYSAASKTSELFYGIRSGIFIFNTVQHFRHSCAPNCSWKIGNAPDFKLRLRAVTTIKAGDELTVCRFPYYKEMRQGTIERRNFISTTMEFLCKCSRCLDPTELNTFFSAIACDSCRKIEEGAVLKRDEDRDSKEFNRGYFLLENPQGESEHWKCNQCSKTISVAEFYPKISSIAAELDKIEMKFGARPSEKVSIAQRDLKNSLLFCSKLINDSSYGFLHPNHWLIMRAKEIVINLNSSRMAITGSPTVEEIDNYIKICKDYILLQEKVMPGEYSYQSFVVYLVTSVMRKKINRLVISRNAKKHVPQIKKLYDELASILIRGIEYYQNEIPNNSAAAENEFASRYRSSLRHLHEMWLTVEEKFKVPKTSQNSSTPQNEESAPLENVVITEASVKINKLDVAVSNSQTYELK